MPDYLLDNVQIRLDPVTLWALNLALAALHFGIAQEITRDDFRQLYRHPRGSLLLFILLLLFAQYDNREVFTDYIWYVFGLVVILNLHPLLTDYCFARFLRNSVADIRWTTIETGIQKSGLGLIPFFTFFEWLGGMALLAVFRVIRNLVIRPRTGPILGAISSG